MVNVVFVHGAGAAGADAWPSQAADAAAGADWLFLPRTGVADDVGRDADRILERLRAVGGGHVVAHSYGANAALKAAQTAPPLVQSLALLEPACFDLARGMLAVEDHISAMTPVFALAHDPGVPAREFSRRFAAAMGTEPPDVPDDELEARIIRLRALRPPWGVGLSTDLGLPPRTLIITAGWSPLYDETASALVAAGAQHLVLEGAGHRVQDHPQCTHALREHWAH